VMRDQQGKRGRGWQWNAASRLIKGWQRAGFGDQLGGLSLGALERRIGMQLYREYQRGLKDAGLHVRVHP
jgi:hypothetical protein